MIEITDSVNPIELLKIREQVGQMEEFNKAMKLLPGALAKLGYTSLRPGQAEAVYNLLKKLDTFCVLPTSAGKSALYKIPTMCLNMNCLIFSPLVALMKDQVEIMWKEGLPAGQISSGQTQGENDMALMAWETGELKYLLIAPERLDNEKFWKAMGRRRPQFVCLDEAHIASEAADTFRPAYKKIGKFIEEFSPEVVLALTATATARVESDIRRIFYLQNAHRVVYLPPRDNLKLRSLPAAGDVGLLRCINRSKGPTIVYFSTIIMLSAAYKRLHRSVVGNALMYHGEMTAEERTTNQNLFMQDESRVMFATNAFGLGINKPNIRAVIHANVPQALEALVQEDGRAGRDGKDSECTLFYDEQGFKVSMYFIENRYPARPDIERVHHFLTSAKDENSCVILTGKEIGENIGLAERVVSSCLSALASSGVVERTVSTAATTKIRILQRHLDPVQDRLLAAAIKIGVKTPDDMLTFELAYLLSEVGMPYKKTLDMLNLLERSGYIRYKPPYRGKVTKLIGPLSLVDFDYFKLRYTEAVQRLDDLKTYINTRDSDKHQFLSRYFGVTK